MRHSLPRNALPCIVCKKELENFEPKGNHPNDGLEFITHGHYGSTTFDPVMGTSFLAINVCDPCISAAAEAGHVLIGDNPVASKGRRLKKWDGQEESLD